MRPVMNDLPVVDHGRLGRAILHDAHPAAVQPHEVAHHVVEFGLLRFLHGTHADARQANPLTRLKHDAAVGSDLADIGVKRPKLRHGSCRPAPQRQHDRRSESQAVHERGSKTSVFRRANDYPHRTDSRPGPLEPVRAIGRSSILLRAFVPPSLRAYLFPLPVASSHGFDSHVHTIFPQPGQPVPYLS